MKQVFSLAVVAVLSFSGHAMAGPWAAVAYVGYAGYYQGPGYWENHGTYLKWNPGVWIDATYRMGIDEGNYSSQAASNAALSRCNDSRCGYITVHNGCVAVAVGKVANGNTKNVGFSTYRVPLNPGQTQNEVRSAAYYGARAACVSTGATCPDVQVACGWL